MRLRLALALSLAMLNTCLAVLFSLRVPTSDEAAGACEWRWPCETLRGPLVATQLMRGPEAKPGPFVMPGPWVMVEWCV